MNITQILLAISNMTIAAYLVVACGVIIFIGEACLYLFGRKKPKKPNSETFTITYYVESSQNAPSQSPCQESPPSVSPRSPKEMEESASE